MNKGTFITTDNSITFFKKEI